MMSGFCIVTFQQTSFSTCQPNTLISEPCVLAKRNLFDSKIPVSFRTSGPANYFKAGTVSGRDKIGTRCLLPFRLIYVIFKCFTNIMSEGLMFLAVAAQSMSLTQLLSIHHGGFCQGSVLLTFHRAKSIVL